MKYKTCVPIIAKTPQAMAKTVRTALTKSNYVEARLDFMAPRDVPAALDLIKPYLNRTVCTLRPKSEGGRFAGGEDERISIIKLVAEYNPYLLDIEYDTIKRNAKLAQYLKSTGTDLLVSWHDFEKTPGTAYLEKKLKAMSGFSDHIKMVCTARSADDAAKMLELYGKRGKTSLISFAMGDLGRFSRVLCLYMGSPYTYASLGSAIAPGQFSVGEIQRIAGLRVKFSV